MSMWNIWPFRDKGIKPVPQGTTIQVYVRDLMVNMDVNDSVLITMSLSNNVNWLWGVEKPDFPYITEQQYQALPERCRSYFVTRPVYLNYTKD